MLLDGYNINFDSKTSHTASQGANTIGIMDDAERCLCKDPTNHPVSACPVHGF
jgi:hypothetical protein